MKSQARLVAILFFCITVVTAGGISGAATRAADSSASGQKKGASTKKSGAAAISQHMKLDQFLALSPNEQSIYLEGYIQKVMDALGPVNPQLPQAVHDYFYKEQPDGTSGLINFTGVLLSKEDQAKQGKLDLSTEEVDGIILGLVKRDVLPKYTKANSPPASSHK